MAGPLEETIEYFIDEVFSNQNLNETTKKQIILSAMQSLASKVTDGTHRWGMSMSLAKLAKEVKQRRN